MRRSWWKNTILLLLAILLCIVLFLAAVTIRVGRQMDRTVIQTNRNTVELWASDTQARLNTLYEHVYELLATIYNKTELRKGSPVMSLSTRQTLLDTMKDKLLANSDADAFFIIDSDNDYYLFSAASRVSSRNVALIKQTVLQEAGSHAGALTDRTWQAMIFGEEPYFWKCICLGKYLVGVVSDMKGYRPEDRFSVLGSDVRAGLTVDGAEYDFSRSDPAESRPGSITVSAGLPALDGVLNLTVVPPLPMADQLADLLLPLGFGSLCFLLVLLLLLRLRRKVAVPTRKLMQANLTLAGGDMDYRLEPSDAGSAEFTALFESFNKMADQIGDLHIAAYDARLREEANKLAMMRAQVRPHTFLNSITTISNMTYLNTPEEVREYITVFARYMRYMLNAGSHFVTVSEELTHIRNYLQLQDVRYPDCISCNIECAPDAELCRIPFLVLYTLVENSVKHAMSTGNELAVDIRCSRLDTEDFHGVLLIEEDSGDGFTQEVLQDLMNEDPDFAKEHLGLTNVRYTLRLIYHRRGLLQISNRDCGGAHIEIRIPDEEGSYEASDL